MFLWKLGFRGIAFYIIKGRSLGYEIMAIVRRIGTEP